MASGMDVQKLQAWSLLRTFQPVAVTEVLQMLQHAHPDVRWAGIQLLARQCHLTSSAAASLQSALLGQVMAGQCEQRWEQHCNCTAALEHLQAVRPWLPATGPPALLQPTDLQQQPVPESGTLHLLRWLLQALSDGQVGPCRASPCWRRLRGHHAALEEAP